VIAPYEPDDDDDWKLPVRPITDQERTIFRLLPGFFGCMIISAACVPFVSGTTRESARFVVTVSSVVYLLGTLWRLKRQREVKKLEGIKNAS
jgi:hypothetical protein